jgi:hypothetical protein
MKAEKAGIDVPDRCSLLLVRDAPLPLIKFLRRILLIFQDLSFSIIPFNFGYPYLKEF